MMYLRFAAASCVFFCASAAWSQVGFGVGSGPIASLYQRSCAECHGKSGEGVAEKGTKTLHTEDFFHQKHDRPFYEAIRDGAGVKADGHAFGGEKGTLKDEQCWALTAYLRELQLIDRRARKVGEPKAGAGGVYDSSHERYRIETVIDKGIQTPWAVEFLPDGRMLVTERPGRLRIHSTGSPGGVLSGPVEGIPEVRSRGQGGLMDVTLHPKFADNGWVYLGFSDAIGNRAMTKVVRGKIRETDGKATWTDEQTIFEAKEEHYLNSDLHYGCRIVFDPKDPTILFFSIGERGRGEHAQNRGLPNGKVHRVKDDGRIPTDNPFADEAGSYGSIWSYGHRNPQGLVFDLEGNLWDSEHGPRGGDELNLVKKGLNYGWPVVSFGINYPGTPYKTPWSERENYEMPVFRWLPAVGQCGLDIVRPGPKGEAFPNWRGDFVAGALSGNSVDRIRVKGDASTGFEFVELEEIVLGLGRVRDVVCAPDGTIYVALNDPDKIIRVVPAATGSAQGN